MGLVIAHAAEFSKTVAPSGAGTPPCCAALRMKKASQSRGPAQSGAAARVRVYAGRSPSRAALDGPARECSGRRNVRRSAAQASASRTPRGSARLPTCRTAPSRRAGGHVEVAGAELLPVEPDAALRRAAGAPRSATSRRRRASSAGRAPARRRRRRRAPRSRPAAPCSTCSAVEARLRRRAASSPWKRAAIARASARFDSTAGRRGSNGSSSSSS